VEEKVFRRPVCSGGVWWSEELRNKNGWFLNSMPIYIYMQIDVCGRDCDV